MNRQDLLASLEVEVQTLDVWLEREWLVPAQGAAEASFTDTDVARGRLIKDLRHGFGVNDEGVDIILHLLDQLHGFRRAFEDIGADLKGRRPKGLDG